MRKIFVIIMTFLSLTLSLFSSVLAEEKILKSEQGLVTKVEYLDMEKNPASEIQQTKQIVSIKLLTGEFKNSFIEIENIITGNPYYDIILTKGKKVVLHAEETPVGIQYYISDLKRTGVTNFLLVLFFLLLIVVGRKKGLFSLLSILLTVLLIFFVLVPLVLLGFSPIISTLLVCIISTCVSMYMVGGINYKSTSAVLGSVLTLIFASILSILTIKFANLTGFFSEECLFLYSAHPELNFTGILTSVMILSALGALMDISMSIASAINEFYQLNRNLSSKELFKSGMNVGQDIIGTMANTLILVYLGGALPLVLLSNEIDLQKFLNLNQVTTEITSALVGSIGLVICVPLTAILCSYLIKLDKNDNNDIILTNGDEINYD